MSQPLQRPSAPPPSPAPNAPLKTPPIGPPSVPPPRPARPGAPPPTPPAGAAPARPTATPPTPPPVPARRISQVPPPAGPPPLRPSSLAPTTPPISESQTPPSFSPTAQTPPQPTAASRPASSPASSLTTAPPPQPKSPPPSVGDNAPPLTRPLQPPDAAVAPTAPAPNADRRRHRVTQTKTPAHFLESFDKMTKDKYVMQLFQVYLRGRNHENLLLFWTQAEAFRTGDYPVQGDTGVRSDPLEHARFILNTFLKGDTASIPSTKTMLQDIEDSIDKKEIDNDLFTNIQKDVVAMLVAGPFVRFAGVTPRFLVLFCEQGHDAPGYRALVSAIHAANSFEMFLVSSDNTCSDQGRDLLMVREVPFTVNNTQIPIHLVTGDITECLRFASFRLQDEQAWVVSGVNRGCTAGMSGVLHSKALTAMTDATFNGMRGILFSMDESANAFFDATVAAAKAVQLIDIIIEQSPLAGTVLNVNFPCSTTVYGVRGYRVTTLGSPNLPYDLKWTPQDFTNQYGWRYLTREAHHVDETPLPDIEAVKTTVSTLATRKKSLRSTVKPLGPCKDPIAGWCDLSLLKNNFVTITPLRFKQTDAAVLETCLKWKMPAPDVHA